MNTETSLIALRLMQSSRAIDDKCKELIRSGTSVPNYHSGTGQEGLSVGVGLALRREDYLLYTYRDFGALLAKGISLDQIACDLLLKKNGTTEGFGGIMHVVDAERGIVGRNGVFGSRFGIAAGLAVASVCSGDARVVVCNFGEAEGSRGPLFEALNFACLRSLPIVFVAENNGFSISTRTSDMFAGGNMSGMWRGFPLPVSVADGNDVESVFALTESALAHARYGLGPVFLEFRTYRIDPHIPADDDSIYRSRDEIREWSRKDPLERFERKLLERGVGDREQLSSMRRGVKATIDAVFDKVLTLDDPDIASIHHHVYFRDTPSDSGGVATLTRK